MEPRDILSELADSRVSGADAEALYDRIMHSEEPGEVKRLLRLTDFEWTAFCHGTPLTTLARWRAKGWPNECVLCGKPVVVENYGWLVREHADGFVLEHIQCPA
jgi:hypothetical protein